ncbi:GntR family transcriptional regulator [Bacillus sp. FJAT-49736]|nr:GntR family transcriptional regulator [Bacillus sp. FJAT-49736]
MEWKPDRNLKKPVYKQIAEHIENGIADGTFPLDKPLPSERGLANLYGVNRRLSLQLTQCHIIVLLYTT